MVPLVIELELGDADAAFSGTGNSWSITQPRLLGDVLQLDQALANSYSKHLIEGKSLPMYCSGLYSLKMSVTSTNVFTIPIVRGFTRLTSVLVSFWDGAVETGSSEWMNRFTHPTNNGLNTAAIDTFSYNMMIGPERFPSFDCQSTQEAWYRLQLARRAQVGSAELSFSPTNYKVMNIVLGQTFEKAGGQSAHTGANTRAGSQLTLHFKELGTATMAHVILFYEQVVNISSAGVEILD